MRIAATELEIEVEEGPSFETLQITLKAIS